MNFQIKVQDTIRTVDYISFGEGEDDFEKEVTNEAKGEAVLFNTFEEATAYMAEKGGVRRTNGDVDYEFLVTYDGIDVSWYVGFPQEFYDWLVRKQYVDVTYDKVLEAYGYKNVSFNKGEGYTASFQGFDIALSKNELGFMVVSKGSLQAKPGARMSYIGDREGLGLFLAGFVSNIQQKQIIKL